MSWSILSRDHSKLGAAALLPVLVVISYHGILAAPFIFDDHANISDNAAIRQLIPPAWLYHHPRPLVVLSFALNYAVGTLDVAGYHLVNILIHVGCGWCAFLVLSRICGSTPWALAVCAIWVVHPLHSTVVSYTVHRFESSVALACLSALYCFQRSSESAHRARTWRCVAWACVVIAHLCKEVSVALPFLLLAYDRCYVAGSFREALQQRWRFHLATFASLGLVAILHIGATQNPSQGFSAPDLSAADYARSQIGVVVYYLRLAFWPDALSMDYFDWPVARSLGQVGPQAVTLLVLASVGAYAWFRHPKAGYVAAVWLLILAPTSSVLPLRGELVAERRVYLPLLALIALVVMSVRWLVRSRQSRNAAVLVAAAVVVALTARTQRRNEDFVTEEAAYRSVLAVRPNNLRARYQLAVVLYARGESDAALQQWLRTIAQEPRCARCQSNVGTIYAQRQRYAEAEERFLAAVRAEPNEGKYRMDLVESRILQQKWVSARNTLRRGLERAPTNAVFQARLRQVEAIIAKRCGVDRPESAQCP